MAFLSVFYQFFYILIASAISQINLIFSKKVGYAERNKCTWFIQFVTAPSFLYHVTLISTKHISIVDQELLLYSVGNKHSKL